MQACPGDTLAMLLAEGRKFGICLTLANQSLRQVGQSLAGNLADAVLANAGNLLLFRLGAPDALALSPWLDAPEDWRQLCKTPDFTLQARLLEHGRPVVHPYVRIARPANSPMLFAQDADCPF